MRGKGYPKEWKIVNIGDCGKWLGGGTPSKSNTDYWENGIIPWASSQDITTNILTQTKYQITKKAVSESSTNIVPPNGIIMVMRSGILRRKFPISKTIKDTAINQDLKAIIPNDMVDADYLYYTIQNDEFKILQQCRKDGTTVESIEYSDFKNFKIPLPPLNEQKKLASIISVWDKAIKLKKNLIEQKKEQKKGLMQKLLTGEVRLPGLNREWKMVKLGEVLKERREIGFMDLELLAITSKKGVVRRTEVDIKDNSSEDKSKYKRILPNDIGYNTMRMWQGVSGVSKYEGIVSPAYTILKPTEKVNSDFMGYLFKLPSVVNQFKRHSQGLVNDTLNLKYENLKVIKVALPMDISEQVAIANVLKCIDREIGVLQKQLNTIKLQKKGLMQKLLTGKIRVKV